jgi:hypothetical protein
MKSLAPCVLLCTDKALFIVVWNRQRKIGLLHSHGVKDIDIPGAHRRGSPPQYPDAMPKRTLFAGVEALPVFRNGLHPGFHSGKGERIESVKIALN